MNTRLTKEDQAMIKEVKGNKISGPIYSAVSYTHLTLPTN